MRVFKPSASFTANFFDDFDFARWELILLLNNVEEQFKVQLEHGLEDNLSTINQLVDAVHQVKRSQMAA